MTRPAADHADQTSIVPILSAAAGLVPATVGGAIVPTLAESQHIGNGKNNV
mgnify:CR=1 FL=1